MFTLDPLSRGVAMTEMLLLLAFAALVGYLLAWLLTNGRINELRTALAEQEASLEECLRKRKTTKTIIQPVPKPVERVASDEEIMFRKIRARASELNFTRIGTATLNEADDLKDIVGVGPFFEKKLHTLGIFSFRQLANFTTEDVEKLSDIIEFFPDRIEREDWVGQARQLQEAKYGRPVN
ncbi:hypothetical protein ACFPMF_01380 [Larkinella bovis]|uniref:DUF4332 domain-containing protein n=1 Tax=Larkinella bovis TaxID=683041 RepID=A0ABW0I609_9BACT